VARKSHCRDAESLPDRRPAMQKHDIESEQIAITVDSLQCDSRDGASNADCEPMLYNISFGNISFGLAGATRAMVHKQAQWAPLE
jgi:hypothetical protein